MKTIKSLLVKKACLLQPGNRFHLKRKDIFIVNGRIEKIGDRLQERATHTIDEKDIAVSTGFTELFSDFCEPGSEHKETLESGSHAALYGGYTDVCLLPDVYPLTQGKAQIEFIRSRSKVVNLHPLGLISKQKNGTDLAEMYDMQSAGAPAFTEGREGLQSGGLLLKALQYVKAFGGCIIQVAEDQSIAGRGLMHEGIVSTRLGVQGKPDIAEAVMIQRDLQLLEYTGSKIHFTGVSTRKGIELIREAKRKKLQVSCSVTPHHLLYTDESLLNYDSVYKVHPPLRKEEDRKALLKAVADGTIDAIATHHMPQDWDAKQVEFEYAQNGMIGLQTTLPLLLSCAPEIPTERWIDMISEAPKRILGLPLATLEEGYQAGLTVFSTSRRWILNEQSNQSRSSNSPVWNKELHGQVLAVANKNQIVCHE